MLGKDHCIACDHDEAVRLLRGWQEVIKEPQFWMRPPYYHQKAAAEKYLEQRDA
jgi:hypothetical protein